VTSELLYARYGARETRTHVSAIPETTPSPSPGDRVLVLDLNGELRAPSLRDRLVSLEVTTRFNAVILRGLSEYLLDEIGNGEGVHELTIRFEGASVWILETDGEPTLRIVVAGGDPVATPANALIALCAQSELEAALVWNNAILYDRSRHFVVPSGHHADRFIRLGDVFADPVNVTRIADWIAYLAHPPCVLIADSFTLLPLMQEIQLRCLRRWRAEIPRWVVPLYGESADTVGDRLAEVVPIARESGARILALVSVTATGGYIAALQEGLAAFDEPPQLEVRSICAATSEGVEPTVPSLCRIQTRQFANKETCDMCKEGQPKPLLIDQTNFTTRLGAEVLALPKVGVIEEQALVIAEADANAALRLHVERGDRHGHLAVYIDTARLLTGKIFRAKATLALARACAGFEPDLVLLPSHDATDSLRTWLHGEGLGDRVDVLWEEAPGKATERIRLARRILLVDDAVISGRTLLRMVEVVQQIKAQSKDGDFQVRGVILVARPALSAIWKGLRDRFFIHHQHGLFGAWEVNLPEIGTNGRDGCPWCAELRWLNNARPACPEAARPYLERRIERLSNAAGLDGRIYLGAEHTEGATGDGWDPSVHTTPGSYLGDVSDVGAFVGAAALLQAMRDEWDRKAERWSMQYALPLAAALARFTDPVIAAALLRGIAVHEVGFEESGGRVSDVLAALDHDAQPPTLAAELLLAARQRKLPRELRTDAFIRQLSRFPADIGAGLEYLLIPAGSG
jgi:hypothetical protein